MSNRRGGLGGEGGVAGDRGRWSSRRKMEGVLRILRGEDLYSMCRELRVTAAALARGETGSRPAGMPGCAAGTPTSAPRDLRHEDQDRRDHHEE